MRSRGAFENPLSRRKWVIEVISIDHKITARKLTSDFRAACISLHQPRTHLSAVTPDGHKSKRNAFRQQPDTHALEIHIKKRAGPERALGPGRLRMARLAYRAFLSSLSRLRMARLAYRAFLSSLS